MSGLQWFVAVDGLKGPAMEAAVDGRITFWPERWRKAYVSWMEGLRDWNISRQLWWGHRIPAWYCPDGHVTVALEDPDACATCGAAAIEQDPDVLDTWFSSQLWPFSTLGWPEETPELEAFYPNAVLVTGYEILYLWVARMIMSGMSLAGDIPFRDVVIHGLVRDAHGRKMSKSLGNVIDPVEIFDLYGADALRFSLARLATGGQQDIPLSVDSIQGGRNFANKIWNAARLVLETFPGGEPQLPPEERLTAPQRWLLARHQRCVAEVNASLDRYEFAAAAQAMYRFFWSEYCDWGLEMEKERLRSEDAAVAEDAANVLAWILERTLRLLHPVMPFVTEEIWQRFGVGETIVRAPWPEAEEFADHATLGADAEAAWPFVEELVTTVRRFRSEHGIPSKTRIELRLVAREPGAVGFAGFENEVLRLAGASDISLVDAGDATGSARLLVQGETVLVPVGDLIDLDAERERAAEATGRGRRGAHAIGDEARQPGLPRQGAGGRGARREAEGRALRARGGVAPRTAGRARLMRFEEAVTRLDLRQPEHMPEPSLDRIRAVSALLDDPQLTYPTIHVTGTNGKTTIARAAADIACAHGVKAGLYTSPHLHTVRERLSVCGVEISEEDFAEEWVHLEPFLEVVDGQEQGASTYFEAVTALAFLWFADKPVGLAVVEVGMGGSWDATNVVASDVAVIGEIGLDHPELGSTVQEVATEKAGIIKAGKTVVVREQPDDALKVIEARASRGGRHRAPGGARLGGGGPGTRGGRTAVPSPGRARDLRGPVPPDVRRARRAERGRGDRRGRVRAGTRARSGRDQVRDRRPAHPRSSRGDHARAADRAGRCPQPGGRRGARAHTHRGVHLVTDARRPRRVVEQGRRRRDRRARAARRPLVSGAERERPELPAEHVAERIAAAGGRVADLGTVEESLAAARDAAATDDLILVTGSLYTVADARRALGGS